MATLQKIRSNKVTQIAIGLGMLGFIAGGMVTMCKRGSQPDTTVTSVNGVNLSQEEFSNMSETYKDAMEAYFNTKVPNETMANIRDYVYNRFAQQQMLNEECEKLGIAVTDEEIANVLKVGTHPVLTSSLFAQDGQFNLAGVQQMLKQYEDAKKSGKNEILAQLDPAYKLWCHTENELKYNLLVEKYELLLGGLMMSNPVSAKASYDNKIEETDVTLVALPFSNIPDADIKVSDSELQSKYDEYKDMFYQFGEARDLKYIDVVVKPSQEDEAALQKEMNEIAANLKKADADIEAIVRQSQSEIPYFGMPIASRVFASVPDVASRLDSMKAGMQSEPYYNMADNSINIIKVLDKASMADSIEFRQINVIGKSAKTAKATADSICAQLKNGVPFDSIASSKTITKSPAQWIDMKQYEMPLATADVNSQKFIKTLISAEPSSLNQIEYEGGVMILEVTQKKSMTDKFDVAVIKRTIKFSDKTFEDTYNKLSSFIAKNKTLAEIEKNQTSDYAVRPLDGVEPSTYSIPGIQESREVIKWAFEEDTKENSISDIKECGAEHEHLIVAVVTGVHAEGYRDIKNEAIKNYLTQFIIKDKKAAMLQDKMKNVKSIADAAQIAGAVTDTIQGITFDAPTYLPQLNAYEAALSGAITGAKGKFVSGVRGQAGVYAFEVNKKGKKADQPAYDEKSEMQNLAMQYMQYTMQMFRIVSPIDAARSRMYGGSYNQMADMKNPVNVFYNAYKNAKREDNRQKAY